MVWRRSRRHSGDSQRKTGAPKRLLCFVPQDRWRSRTGILWQYYSEAQVKRCEDRCVGGVVEANGVAWWWETTELWRWQ